MKKAESPKTTKKKIRPLIYFVGGLTSVFMWATGGKKNDDPNFTPDTRPAITGSDPNCKKPFTRVTAVSDAAIEGVIEKLESPALTSWAFMHDLVAHTARERGYHKATVLAEGIETPLINRLTRDLRMMMHYRGPITNTFTTEVKDALKSFQEQRDLTKTGQPDGETLKALAQEMAAMELKIALYATRTAQRHNIAAQDLLLLIAAESGGDPMAAAKTSSALGLGQFLEETWMDLMARNGAAIGFARHEKEAKVIQKARLQSRALTAEEKAARTSILNMRTDMAVSIDMIALYGLQVTGGKFTARDAYAGYFLGEGDLAKFLKNPDALAHVIAPRAAKANEPIFYKNQILVQVMAKDKKGRLKPVKGKFEKVWVNPRTTTEVIEYVISKVGMDQRAGDAARMLGNVRRLNLPVPGESPQNVKCAPSIVPSDQPQTAGRNAPLLVN